MGSMGNEPKRRSSTQAETEARLGALEQLRTPSAWRRSVSSLRSGARARNSLNVVAGHAEDDRIGPPRTSGVEESSEAIGAQCERMRRSSCVGSSTTRGRSRPERMDRRRRGRRQGGRALGDGLSGVDPHSLGRLRPRVGSGSAHELRTAPSLTSPLRPVEAAHPVGSRAGGSSSCAKASGNDRRQALGVAAVRGRRQARCPSRLRAGCALGHVRSGLFARRRIWAPNARALRRRGLGRLPPCARRSARRSTRTPARRRARSDGSSAAREPRRGYSTASPRGSSMTGAPTFVTMIVRALRRLPNFTRSRSVQVSSSRRRSSCSPRGVGAGWARWRPQYSLNDAHQRSRDRRWSPSSSAFSAARAGYAFHDRRRPRRSSLTIFVNSRQRADSRRALLGLQRVTALRRDRALSRRS